MPIARQPELQKALKFRARLTGQYETRMDGVYLSEIVGESAALEAGETRHITLDCGIELLKNSFAFVQINPALWKLGTITGPLILSDTVNTIDLRIEADEDIDLAELDYVAKIIFESIY